MMRLRFFLIAAALSGCCLGAVAADNPVADSTVVRSGNLLRQVQAEDTSIMEQLLRCCWAQSRPAFKYCEEYGVCASSGEGTRCIGRGAAEGRELTCAAAPPEPSSPD